MIDNRNKRRALERKTIKSKIIKHIEVNIKSYSLIFLLFLVGIILGVLVINKYANMEETINYIMDITNQLKENGRIDRGLLLNQSIKSNLLFVLFMWFIGLTVIGIPIVYGTIVFRGFSFGYTIRFPYNYTRNHQSSNVCKCGDIVTKSILYSMFVNSRGKLH